MFQSTPSAKSEWRQESGYSQQKLWPKEKSLIAVLTNPPIHARTTTQKGRRATCWEVEA